MKNVLLRKMFFLSLCLCMGVSLLGQVTETQKDKKGNPPTSSSMPCQFSWAAVVPFGNTTTINVTEDKECQPYQGPCVAFSYIKAMEAKLNIQHNNACRILDFSVPFLDFAAYFNPNAYMTTMNGGLGVPVDGCGEFPPFCGTFGPGSTCDCIPNMIRTQAIDEDLCFVVSSAGAEPGNENDCEDIWDVSTSPITGPRLHASGIGSPTINSVYALKQKIIQNGPVVAVIDVSILDNFRDYADLDNLSFHSFTIIGWEEFNSTTTVWKINDHWPGEGQNFCGLGETNPILNTKLLQYFQDDDLAIYTIGEVWVEEPDGNSGCQDANRLSFSYTDQDNCEPLFCPDIVVTDIVIDEVTNCLIQDRSNDMVAYVSPCNSTHLYEYEWVIVNELSPLVNPFSCGSTARAIINSANSVTVKVRVRYSEQCEWSDWRIENLCVDEPGGGGGPLFHSNGSDELSFSDLIYEEATPQELNYQIININGQVLQKGMIDSVNPTINIGSINDPFILIHLSNPTNAFNKVIKYAFPK